MLELGIRLRNVTTFERFLDKITYILIDRSRFHTDVWYINYGTLLSREVKRINEINVNNLASLKRRKKRKKIEALKRLGKIFYR